MEWDKAQACQHCDCSRVLRQLTLDIIWGKDRLQGHPGPVCGATSQRSRLDLYEPTQPYTWSICQLAIVSSPLCKHWTHINLTSLLGAKTWIRYIRCLGTSMHFPIFRGAIEDKSSHSVLPSISENCLPSTLQRLWINLMLLQLLHHHVESVYLAMMCLCKAITWSMKSWMYISVASHACTSSSKGLQKGPRKHGKRPRLKAFKGPTSGTLWGNEPTVYIEYSISWY